MGESLVRENIFTFYVNGFITLPPPFASDLQNSDPWPLTKIYLCLLHINAQVLASKRHKHTHKPNGRELQPRNCERGGINSFNFPTLNNSTSYFEGGLSRNVSKSKVVKGASSNNNRYLIWKNGL